MFSILYAKLSNLFHEGLELWLGSVVIARRIGVHLPHGVVYPNLAIAWIATTTLWRKTTALDIGRGLIRRLIPHMLLPQETTPEALLSDLAGLEPPNIYTMSDDAQALFKMERNFAAQRGLMVDEMSGMLAGAGRDYNAGLIESFLKFYDCEELYVRSTRSQGRVAVRDAYLPILGASTPTAMAPHLGSERLWSMGWWPRFALLTPDADRPVWQTSRSVQESPELTGALLRLYSRLPSPIWPNPPQVVRAELGKGTLAAWERYAKAMSYDLLTPALNHRLFGLYGRLPTQVLKIAIILAALDWPTAAQTHLISEAHLARAILIAEGWRASAHRALLMARRHSFSSSLVDRVRLTLTRFQPAGGPTIRDLQRAIPDAERTELDAALRQLVEAGEANLVNCLSGPQGGRPTTRYRLVSS